MGIKVLLKDVFERVNYIDKNVENPFVNKNNQGNPFAQYFSGTYVWIDTPENNHFN